MTKQELQTEALGRALQSQSWANYPAIIQGFIAKGVPEDQIRPRENVFTYHAWRALGRQVKRGEHGVRVVTVRHLPAKIDAETGETIKPDRSIPWTATVFHVSQTDPIAARKAG